MHAKWVDTVASQLILVVLVKLKLIDPRRPLTWVVNMYYNVHKIIPQDRRKWKSSSSS